MSSKRLKKRFSFVRYLSIRSAGCPTFSSDGKHVAFLMNTTGVPQVWRVALDGGWPEQLTFYSEEVSFCRYSPVGDHLIFGMDRGGNERIQFYLLREGADAEPLTNKPNVIHTLGDWARDGRWISPGRMELCSLISQDSVRLAVLMDAAFRQVDSVLTGWIMVDLAA